METGYRKIKKTNVLKLLLCSLLYCGSNQIVICQNVNDYIGRYKYNFSPDFPKDTTILDLQENGRFTYSPFSIVYISYPNCDSIKGSWTIKGNSIILNSDFQIKDYIKILSKSEHKDSVKIKLITYPSGELFREEEFIITNSKISFFAKTDENGIIVIPKGYNISLFPFNIINPPKYSKLKGGYYYQFTYADCDPEIFENQKLEIHGDTLVMYRDITIKRRGRHKEKPYIVKYEYIKVR